MYLKNNKDVKNKLESIFSKINKKQDDELLIYGELLLVKEKVAKGDFAHRISHINTSNHKLNYIAKSINKLIFDIRNNLDMVSKIIDDYRKALDDTSVVKIFHILIKSMNLLQETITNILIENKSNGLTLDKSSDILLANVDKLNISSNEAVESLEETAVVLEHIRNNTENIAKMANYSNGVTKSLTHGEKLANQTTVAKVLNENIIKTIEVIKKGELSSEEQLNGIEQINHSITLLDQQTQQTQQNTAIVSQTYDVAIQTDSISKVILSSVDTKKFIDND